MDFEDHKTPDSEIKFDKSQTFDVQTNEIAFKLKISFNDKLLLFEVEKVEEFPKNIYNKILSLQELLEIDSFFLQFKTPEILVDSFNFIIKNNNLSIYEEDNVMKIKIINIFTKAIFTIDVPMKEKELKDQINSIIPCVSSLNIKMDKIEDDLKAKEQKIKNLKMI